MATEPMMGPRLPPGGPNPSSRAVSRPCAEREGLEVHAGRNRDDLLGRHASATTSRRMASPLVITRSASHR